jgi:CelD/BcsL family acetyltransferase involved in cellulose biosynthesis
MSFSITATAEFADAAPPLTQEVHRLEHNQEVPHWWHDLHAQTPHASMFVSPLWLGAWIKHYGAAFSGQWVRWLSQGQTVGAVLVLRRMRISKGVPLRTLYLNTSEDVGARSPQTEFNQILHLPQFTDQVLSAIANYLHSQRWDCISFSGFEHSALVDSLVNKLRGASVHAEVKPAPFVGLTGLALGSFEQTLAGRAGAQIRQSFRHYEEKFGPLRLEHAQDQAQRQEYLQELAQLHNTLWRDRGMAGAFECAKFMAFHQGVIAQGGANGQVKLMRAYAGQHLLGYLYAFKDHGCVYVYQSGFCYENDTKLRPGLVTHALAISACRDEGLQEYNLMAGDSQYKRALAKERRNVVWTTLYGNTLAGRLFLALRGFKRILKPVANDAANTAQNPPSDPG